MEDRISWEIGIERRVRMYAKQGLGTDEIARIMGMKPSEIYKIRNAGYTEMSQEWCDEWEKTRMIFQRLKKR